MYMYISNIQTGAKDAEARATEHNFQSVGSQCQNVEGKKSCLQR